MKTKHFFLILFVFFLTGMVSCNQENTLLPEEPEQSVKPQTKGYYDGVTLLLYPYRNIYVPGACSGHFICSGGYCIYCGYPRQTQGNYNYVDPNFTVYSERFDGEYGFITDWGYSNWFGADEEVSDGCYGSTNALTTGLYLYMYVPEYMDVCERGLFRLETDHLMKLYNYDAEALVRGYDKMVIEMKNPYNWRIDYNVSDSREEDPYGWRQFIIDIARVSLETMQYTDLYLNIPVIPGQETEHFLIFLDRLNYEIYNELGYDLATCWYYEEESCYRGDEFFFRLYFNGMSFEDAYYSYL